VETLEISVLFQMASFLFFAVAISVNHQQGENNQAGGKKDYDERFIPPHLAHEIGEIGIHFRPIYTMPWEKTKSGLKKIIADYCCHSGGISDIEPVC
jgi:hypothetical protein